MLRRDTEINRFNLGSMPEVVIEKETGVKPTAERRVTVTTRPGSVVEYFLGPMNTCDDGTHGAPLCSCASLVIRAGQWLTAKRVSGGVESVVSVTIEYLS